MEKGENESENESIKFQVTKKGINNEKQLPENTSISIKWTDDKVQFERFACLKSNMGAPLMEEIFVNLKPDKNSTDTTHFLDINKFLKKIRKK
jgi:hypothetical protein